MDDAAPVVFELRDGALLADGQRLGRIPGLKGDQPVYFSSKSWALDFRTLRLGVPAQLVVSDGMSAGVLTAAMEVAFSGRTSCALNLGGGLVDVACTFDRDDVVVSAPDQMWWDGFVPMVRIELSVGEEGVLGTAVRGYVPRRVGDTSLVTTRPEGAVDSRPPVHVPANAGELFEAAGGPPAWFDCTSFFLDDPTAPAACEGGAENFLTLALRANDTCAYGPSPAPSRADWMGSARVISDQGETPKWVWVLADSDVPASAIVWVAEDWASVGAEVRINNETSGGSIESCEGEAGAPTASDGKAAAAAKLIAQVASEAGPIDMRVYNSSSMRFAACGLAARRYKAWLSGVLKVRLEVGPDGRITQVDIYDDTVGDARYRSCMEDIYFGLRLADTGDARTVRFKYELHAPYYIRVSKKWYARAGR